MVTWDKMLNLVEKLLEVTLLGRRGWYVLGYDNCINGGAGFGFVSEMFSWE